jgi:hypothetical protein
MPVNALAAFFAKQQKVAKDTTDRRTSAIGPRTPREGMEDWRSDRALRFVWRRVDSAETAIARALSHLRQQQQGDHEEKTGTRAPRERMTSHRQQRARDVSSILGSQFGTQSQRTPPSYRIWTPGRQRPADKLHRNTPQLSSQSRPRMRRSPPFYSGYSRRLLTSH